MNLAMSERAADDATQGTSEAADLAAAIVNSSFDAIISKTLDGKVTSWNPAASELFGYHSEEMIGEPVRRLIPRDRQDEEDRILAKIKAGERVESYVTVRLDKEQRPIVVSLTLSPIWDQSRKIIGASEIIRNIALQKDASDTLRQSAELMRQFVDQAPVAIMMLDRNMRHLASSRRWIEDYLFEDVDITGRSLYEVFPEVPERWKEAHRRALAGEVVRADEDVFERPNGRIQWVRWEARPWLMSDRTIGGITIMSEDVTDKVLVLRALRESEMRMRLAQEAAKAAAWEWRLVDNSLQCSDSLWGLYRVQKPDEWEPSIEGWVSIMHPADRERVIAAVMGAVALGQDYEAQWRLNVPDGEPERWFLTRGRPIADHKGSPDRYFGVIIDITEQKLLEAALRESEERQSFLLSLNDALRTVGDPLETIAIASEMLGQKLNAAQVVYAKTGETGERASITHEWNDGVVSGAFAIDRMNDFAASLVENLKNGQTVAISDVRLDPRSCNPEALAILELGSIAAFIAVPFIKNRRLAGGLAVHKRTPHAWRTEDIALAQEVAERTWEAVERAHVAQALRDSKDRLKFALEAGEVGSWEMSLETRKYTASDQALSFFDLPPGTQPSYEEIIARVHPDDQLATDQALRRTAETGQPLRIEFRRLLPDGSIRWLDARAERRSVAGRQVMGGLVQDITERVNQKEAVERAAKAKSEFLSNMSHELRTPMHAILGYAEICTDAVREGEGENIERYLNNITAAGGRLLILLNDLLDLAKMESGRMDYKPECGDLREVIEHALMELDPLIKAKKLNISVKLEEHTAAYFDKTHLIQVLINLVSNAIKFSNAESQIAIDVSEDRLSSGERGVQCRVADEGPGIPDDELEAVFDKFVQSKKTKTGKGGTGLGLAICDRIIKAHGGAIWAENAKPHGAVFTFVIPKDLDARGHATSVANSGQ